MAFRTVTGEQQAASACLDYVDDYLSARGMHVSRSESNGFPSLVATTRKSKAPKLMLQAHIDVVSAPDDCYKLHEKRGRLMGRGVFDMKFAAAIFMKITDDLQGTLTDHDFGIMLTSDEEVGGADGVKALLNDGYKPAVCLLPDAGDDWRIETSHKGCWTVRVRAGGMAAHGSRPWEGENAIDRLVDMLSETRKLFEGQHADTDTLSINEIVGGSATNQVADKAQATLDIRFVSEASYGRIHKKVNAIAKRHGVLLEDIRNIRISTTDVAHPLVASFLKVAKQIHGRPLNQVRSLGTSDAYYFADMGIPVILVRPGGGSAHGDGEWIDKEGLEKYYRVVKAYVEEVCAGA